MPPARILYEPPRPARCLDRRRHLRQRGTLATLERLLLGTPDADTAAEQPSASIKHFGSTQLPLLSLPSAAPTSPSFVGSSSNLALVSASG